MLQAEDRTYGRVIFLNAKPKGEGVKGWLKVRTQEGQEVLFEFEKGYVAFVPDVNDLVTVLHNGRKIVDVTLEEKGVQPAPEPPVKKSGYVIGGVGKCISLLAVAFLGLAGASIMWASNPIITPTWHQRYIVQAMAGGAIGAILLIIGVYLELKGRGKIAS
jgi:hypothetical protein